MDKRGGSRNKTRKHSFFVFNFVYLHPRNTACSTGSKDIFRANNKPVSLAKK